MTAPTEQTGWTIGYDEMGRCSYFIKPDGTPAKDSEVIHHLNRLDALEKLLSAKEKEIERMREALSELKAACIKYGRHRDGCLEIEEGDKCNCGYGKLLTPKQG